MKILTWRSFALALALTVCAVVSLLVIPRAQGEGCTRVEGYRPVSGGCMARTGAVCYYCEKPNAGGGYSICGENVSGTISLCTDYQDLPPFPNF